MRYGRLTPSRAGWIEGCANSRRRKRAPGSKATYPPSGDQAGSDAFVDVGILRWLNPVMSIDARCDENPWPWLPVARVVLKNMMTRPFGQKVGPSTPQPSAIS